MEYNHRLSYIGGDGPPQAPSQLSSTVKDNSYMGYDSVPASEENTAPPRLRPDIRTHIFGWWKYELLASVISIGAIMALALVIRRFEGRPIQDINLPKSLQLSAIVAALSTVVRVSMLVPVASAMSQDSWLWMSSPSQLQDCRSRLKDLDVTDNASRGPWGSFLFLFKARGRYFAYIGALITILSLGLSTFTQQLVVLEVLPINKGVAALPNIPRSQSWSSNQGIMDAVVRSINPYIKAAVFNGIFTAGVPPPSLTCATGNCTWPVTPSLAVCGGCTKSTFTQSCNKNDGYVRCNFTVPSGNHWTNGTGLYFNAKQSTGSVYNSSDPTRLYLSNFEVGGVSNSSYGWTAWNQTTFVAYECALWACVKSYSASVQASTQIQTVNSTWSNIIGIQNSSSAYQINATFGNPTNETDTQSGTDQYTVTEIAALLLRQYMIPFFNGSVNAPGSRGIAYSDDYIEVLYNATQHSDLSGLVTNLANSMSNVFRTAEPAQNDAYNGVASTLSVAIKWKWIVFPVILVAASLLMSLINIVRTARSDIGAFKGGPLAFLMCGLDESVRNVAVGSMGKPEGLVRSVGDRKVVLGRDEKGGWVFAAAR